MDQNIFAMKNTFHLLSAIALILLTAACEIKIIQDSPDEETSDGYSTVRISFSEPGNTRSSISPDESKIEFIKVLAYMDGQLVTCAKADGNEDIELELRQGVYNIYALANMHGYATPVHESEIIESTYRINSIEDIADTIPMCGSGEITLHAGDNEEMDIVLERLVSKILLSVNTGVLEGLEITSVRLCQGAAVLRPFMEGGSRVLDRSETGNGDYASSIDLEKLNNGRRVLFYIPENCQGVLLPDNSDPWKKSPENIGDAAYLCTYIEMKCRWLDSADYEGEVTYRFYLGENAVTDFNIRRNSVHNMTLFLQENSLEKICWKIDSSDMGIARWGVESNLDDNFHKPDEFYISEMIRIDFRFDDKGEKYWSKRDYGFSLKGIDSEGKETIHFNKFVKKSDGSFYAVGTCYRKGDFRIVMVSDETGEVVYEMNSGKINVPKIVIGPDGVYEDEPVESLGSSIKLSVNGGKKEFCLYLTDDDGYNLNQGHFYGCDTELCDWEIELYNDTYSYTLSDKAIIQMEYGTPCSDSYAVKYSIKISNDGKDSGWNERLTGSLGENVLRLECCENISGAYETDDISLSASDITVTMKPVTSEVKDLFGTEFMYVVKNSSKIPFTITGIKENSLYSKDKPDDDRLWDVICPPVPDFICTYELIVSKMASTHCSFDSSSSASYVKGNEIWYAADDDGIDQSSIPNQLSLFHVLKAETTYPCTDPPAIIGSQILDGTSSDVEKYGNTGFRNVGMKFYSGTELYEDYNSYDNLYTDFKYYGDLQTPEGIEMINDIIEITFSINEKNEIQAVASEPVNISLSLDGTLYGHIRCVTSQDPFDTVWGHYFTDQTGFSASGNYSLGTSPVAISSTCLTQALTDLREKKYYSALDVTKASEFRDPGYYGSTTIREYLKPNGLDIAINITPVNGKAYAVKFDGTLSYDFKTSSPVTWNGLWTSSKTMVPSTYSGFDNKLSKYDCPAGEVFKAETVILSPQVSFSKNHDIYYITGEPEVIPLP